MKENLYINNTLARNHGVMMGENFISTLQQANPMKEYIENASRLSHGKVITMFNPRMDARTFSLVFQIVGNTEEEYLKNKEWLYRELYKGRVDIKCNEIKAVKVVDGTETVYVPTYHLVYTGKSLSYGELLGGTMGKLTAGFEEPNPSEREETCTSIIGQ